MRHKSPTLANATKQKCECAIRGIDANLGLRNADRFRADLHPDLKTDFILANSP